MVRRPARPAGPGKQKARRQAGFSLEMAPEDGLEPPTR